MRNVCRMILVAAVLAAGGAAAEAPRPADATKAKPAEGAKAVSKPEAKVVKTDEEWKAELSPKQYEVLRKKGTEWAFSGAFWDNHEPGTYRCGGCGAVLFRSTEKYDSGSGWPSFTEVAIPGAVEEHRDASHGMERVEITCARCGGHLGHVFPDGPGPNGLRYCVNSASLAFEGPGGAVTPGDGARKPGK